MHHREIDMKTGESRVPYFFEIMRYVEAKHGWRPSTGLFSVVKNELIDKDKYVVSEMMRLQSVPTSNRSLRTTVEYLLLTEQGRDRLRDDLLTTRTMLVNTQSILIDWREKLKIMIGL
jgi:hypothetical protein